MDPHTRTCSLLIKRPRRFSRSPVSLLFLIRVAVHKTPVASDLEETFCSSSVVSVHAEHARCITGREDALQPSTRHWTLLSSVTTGGWCFYMDGVAGAQPHAIFLENEYFKKKHSRGY